MSTTEMPPISSTATAASPSELCAGATPEGLRVAVRGCDFYTFRDGLVVQKDAYWKIVV